MNKRPVLVTVVSLVLIASGVAGLAYHFHEIAPPHHLEDAFVAVVRLLAIVAGAFMLRGADWARWLAMLWIAFHVIVSAFHPIGELVVHVVVFAAFAGVLFHSTAARYFRNAKAA